MGTDTRWAFALVGALAWAGAAIAGPCADQKPLSPEPVPDGFSFAAAGDIIYQRPSLALVETGAPDVVRVLRRASVTFGNFESNAFDLASFPGTFQRSVDGPVVLTPPAVAAEVRSLGFSLVSAANNHTGDWGSAGVLATDQTLCQAGLANAGGGANLAAARAPTYALANGVPVGLVAATATYSESDPAVDAWGPVRARPGVDPLRVGKDGQPDPDDLAALTASVVEARRHAGLVFFSLHAHDPGPTPETPPAFEISLAHAVIDAGADGFLGHGPHQLRGVEIYKGRPIFYSLGNFAVMQPTPGLDPKPLVILPGTIFASPAYFEGAIAEGRYHDGRLTEVRLYPFEMADTKDLASHGLPTTATPDEAAAILKRLQALSAPFGTRIDIEGAVGVIRLPGS